MENGKKSLNIAIVGIICLLIFLIVVFSILNGRREVTTNTGSSSKDNINNVSVSESDNLNVNSNTSQSTSSGDISSDIKFDRFMQNVKARRESGTGVWKEDVLKLTLNLSEDDSKYSNEITTVINKYGDCRLVISNYYLYMKYSDIYPNISEDAVDVMSGSKINNIAQFIYILNGDGTVTQLKVLDEIEIVENYKDLKNIILFEKREHEKSSEDDNADVFVCYDIDGNIFYL